MDSNATPLFEIHTDTLDKIITSIGQMVNEMVGRGYTHEKMELLIPKLLIGILDDYTNGFERYSFSDIKKVPYEERENSIAVYGHNDCYLIEDFRRSPGDYRYIYRPEEPPENYKPNWDEIKNNFK